MKERKEKAGPGTQSEVWVLYCFSHSYLSIRPSTHPALSIHTCSHPPIHLSSITNLLHPSTDLPTHPLSIQVSFLPPSRSPRHTCTHLLILVWVEIAHSWTF